MTLAEKYHQETVSLMKSKGKGLDEETKKEIIQSIEDSLMDGDFEASVKTFFKKGDVVKAFLIGEGLISSF